MALECEAKIQVDDIRQIQNRLRKTGAYCAGVVLEKNWILDTPEESNRNSGVSLRIRSTGGPGGVLTVKRPVKGGSFKSREELETQVECTETLLAQFRNLGYSIAWIYEKYRQTWQWRDCTILLDECPEIGCFVEIEGTPEMIRKAAAQLELDLELHLAGGYRKLWRKHLKFLGQKPRHMLFPTGFACQLGRLENPNGKRLTTSIAPKYPATYPAAQALHAAG